MTLRTALLNDVRHLSEDELIKAYQFVDKLKKNDKKRKKKVSPLSFAGILSDKDAKEITEIISKEFSKIEGEW